MSGSADVSSRLISRSFADATMNRDIFNFGPFRLDATQGLLTRGDRPVNVPPKVFAVLCLLAEQRGGVVSKAKLMESLWPESYVGESSLTQNIFLLRKALGPTEDGREYIETLSKRGYRIAVPVEILQEPLTSGLSPLPAEPGALPEVADDVPLNEAPDSRVNELTEVLSSRSPSTRPPLPQVWQQNRLLISLAVACFAVAVSGYLVGKHLLMWQKPMILRSRRLTNDGAYKEHLIPLLLDGSHIYFSEDVDTTSSLAEVAVEGGETLRHKSPTPTSTALSYSKNDNEILFGSLWERTPEYPLLAQSMPGGAVHSVGGLSGHSASWSPDGRKIVFAKGLSIYVADNKGANIRELARMAETPHWPRWSPDGRRIRFSVAARNESTSLWEVEATGQDLHPLFSRETWSRQACCGDWTPDGRYYVFVVDDGRRSTLWTAYDSDRAWLVSRPVELADGPADFWRAPVVAPDGKHIFALGEHARGRLVKYDGQMQRFAPFLNGLSTDTLSFSRDGQWVAYTAYPEGTLWRSRVDGSDRLRLTDPPRVARFPQWSPDGSQILYISVESDGQWKIHKVPAAGGPSIQFIHDYSSQGVATWSNDGTQVAFGQIVGFGVQKRTQNIRIFDFKSGELADLPGSNGLWTARWSPDGRYIAAVTVDNRRLMLYDFQTKQWRQLAEVGTNDVVWTPDSREILFDSTDEPAIYRVTLKDQQLKKEINFEGLRRTGFYGWSLNIAPDSSPVLLEEAGINEAYVLDTYFP